MADFTKVAGNPASRLQNDYRRLMAIESRSELHAEFVKIIDLGGISPKNMLTAKRNAESNETLDGLRKYITYYILAASGNRVLQPGSRF